MHARRLAAALLLLAPAAPRAWIYPEHRDIAVAGIQKLTPDQQALLSRLWDEAREGYDGKLCPVPNAGEQGLVPPCLDFAAFPALSGDHSCSPQQAQDRVLRSDWILEVARVAAETKRDLASAADRDARVNVMATSNLAMQSVDPDYVSRAGANNAHFQLPRVDDDFAGYVATATLKGAPLNAMGLYFQYHLAALEMAHRYATASLPPAERGALARRILVTEGYALHWLEDIFSSGHDVGTWGSDAWRKGTHDYYSEFGLDHVTWGGDHVVVFGDANMKRADLRRGSDAVRGSLAQLTDALRPGDELGALAVGFGPGPDVIFAFDSCQEERQPESHPAAGGLERHFADQLRAMPVPARGEGDVHVPRFREELGLFVGGFATLTGALRWGGFGPENPQFFGALTAGVRLGFGAESLTGSAGTGLAWLEFGLAMQTAQNVPCDIGPECAFVGFFPIVPARTGFRLGMRLPFYVIPGDMLILGPVLAIASPSALSAVGVAAASGGLIPYERGFNVGAGTLQIVVGREFDATFFGYTGAVSILVDIPPQPDGNSGAVAQLKSLQLNFPVLEWTPFKTFATQLVFAADLQLGFGVEIPLSAPIVYPQGLGSATLGPSWSIFLRGTFEGRYFFGAREDLASPKF